jgi:CheY-like chemotaxis protein
MNGVVLYIDDDEDNIFTPATAAIPVVILSGDSNPATVDELLAAGAADFLGKPFEAHQLLAILGRYLT